VKTQDQINEHLAATMVTQVSDLLIACQNLGATLRGGALDDALHAGNYLLNAELNLKRIANGYHRKKERGTPTDSGQAAGGKDVQTAPGPGGEAKPGPEGGVGSST